MQGNRSDPQTVFLSVTLYHALVRIYPAAFRDAYGELMVQAFRDTCLQAARGGRPGGLLSLWVRTLLDVFLSVIEQYSNRGAVMTRSKWIRISGWLLAASSFVMWAGWVAAMRPEYSEYNAASLPIDRYLKPMDYPLLILGMLLTAVGILGLLTRFGRQAGGLGRVGLVLSLLGAAVNVVGIIGLSIRDASPWWEMNLLGMTVLFIGLGLFGTACIRRKLLGRWNSLPLLVSLPWPLLILADVLLHSVIGVPLETPWQMVTITFAISFAGLALIGYRLQSEAQGSPGALA